jgi:hypothetical protein
MKDCRNAAIAARLSAQDMVGARLPAQDCRNERLPECRDRCKIVGARLSAQDMVGARLLAQDCWRKIWSAQDCRRKIAGMKDCRNAAIAAPIRRCGDGLDSAQPSQAWKTIGIRIGWSEV